MRSLPAKLTLCILTMLLLGGLGAFFTSSSINDWYRTLARPPGTPPSWVFAPVWSTLYAMIGISAAVIWHHHPQRIGKTLPTFLFVIQLLLNLAWSPVFFGMHEIKLALLIILFLWIFILLTIMEFSRFSKPAAALLIPYLLWVSYATYLNIGYSFLN